MIFNPIIFTLYFNVEYFFMKVVITNNTNASLIPVSHAGITVVKPEQSFRQNGQIVIQSPASTQPSSNCINLVDLTQTQDQQFLGNLENYMKFCVIIVLVT